jgi:hypothetical protein
MKFKESDLIAAIAAIEEDLDKSYELAKSELLAKADGDDEADESAGPPVDSSDPTASESVDASATPAGEMPPAAPDASAAAPAGPEASSPAPDASADPAAAGGAEAPLSMEALRAEYVQLPPEELEMHIQAAMAAKEAMSGAAGGAGAPAPDAAPMTPSPDAGMSAPALKRELPQSNEAANGGMSKSEKNVEVEMLKKEFANLRKSLEAKDKEMELVKKSVQDKSEDVENLTKALKMVLERPERKAVTGISYLGKTESTATTPTKTSFTPVEANKVLKNLIPTLSKSERQVVLDYYSGAVKIDALAPILEKANLK